MKRPYTNDPDVIVHEIRRGLADGHDGSRVTCRDQAMAEAIVARLTPIERSRVQLTWADFPDWDFDDYGDPIERTHTALRRN